MYIPAKINTKLNRILFIFGLYCWLSFFCINVNAQNYDFSIQIPLSKTVVSTFDPNKVIDSLQNLGFLAASYYLNDYTEADSVKVYSFQKGERFTWGSINYYIDGARVGTNATKSLLNQYADKKVLEKQIDDYLTSEAHNRGYPFADAILQIDSINNYKVYASVNISLKNQIVYDSLILKSDKRIINKDYLQHYLHMPLGALFNTAYYQSITEKIKRLKFLKLVEPPLLQFSNSKSQITLNLKSVPENQLEAFLGLIPTGEKTNLTGQVDVSFLNLFKRAVIWQLNWQKYSANSQFLNTYLSQKSAFKSPLGIEAQFSLLQEDSTFLQNSYYTGLLYSLNEPLTLGLGYKGVSNVLIRELDSTEIKTLNEPFRSSQINSIKFSAGWRQAITYPVLQNDYYIRSDLDIGVKKIKNHSNLSAKWKDIPERSENFNLLLELGAQQKLMKRFLIEQRFQLAIVGNKFLARNDLLRLGGLQNLRGFDRNFFYTSNYGLLNFNYRYFLDNNSSFFLLTDIAKLQKSIGTVYAFGAGLDVKSKNGWFRLIYAVGSNVNQKINFSTAKVHFGYIALF